MFSDGYNVFKILSFHLAEVFLTHHVGFAVTYAVELSRIRTVFS